MFRRIGGVVWDVMSGTVGLQTENGIYTASFPEGGGAPTVSVNPLDNFGLAIPAFATQTPFADVALGEIIVGDQGIIGWVTEKTEAAFKVLDHNGYHKTYQPPKVAIMGSQGVLVVRNLFSLTGGAAGAGNFASNLLPLLALGGGDDKLEKMLPLLLMSSTMNNAGAAAAPGAAAAGNGMANILPFLLLKDGGLGGLTGGSGGGTMDKLLPFMLMGGMGGGAGGMNPMMMAMVLGGGDLFGGSTGNASATPALTPVRGGIPVLKPL